MHPVRRFDILLTGMKPLCSALRTTTYRLPCAQVATLSLETALRAPHEENSCSQYGLADADVVVHGQRYQGAQRLTTDRPVLIEAHHTVDRGIYTGLSIAAERLSWHGRDNFAAVETWCRRRT